MKRGKRFIENENMFIYVGAVIFILLAVTLGVIMYMTTRTGVRIERNVAQEQQTDSDTESVTADIGKTVEEQAEKIEKEEISKTIANEIENTSIANTEEKVAEKKENETPETPNEPDTTIETEASETKKEITFIKPTEGEIICEYAKDNLIYSETLKEWITHTGIDIKADKTSVIKSAADGVIKSIVNDPRYGLTVVIEHDEGYQTVYSNLLTAEFIVVGEEVTQGQTIGTVGNTAAFESKMEYHLHFELLKDGEYLDPTIQFR